MFLRFPLSLLLLKTLIGPNCTGPAFEILPKFERSPALLVDHEGPVATAQPSAPTCSSRSWPRRDLPRDIAVVRARASLSCCIRSLEAYMACELKHEIQCKQNLRLRVIGKASEAQPLGREAGISTHAIQSHPVYSQYEHANR